MKYISRHMEERIMELSKSYSAILVTGPRQAGKTTMLHSLAEKENIGRKYVTLDDFTARDMAKNDPALFLQIHKPPCLLMRCSMRRSCLSEFGRAVCLDLSADSISTEIFIMLPTSLPM